MGGGRPAAGPPPRARPRRPRSRGAGRGRDARGVPSEAPVRQNCSRLPALSSSRARRLPKVSSPYDAQPRPIPLPAGPGRPGARLARDAGVAPRPRLEGLAGRADRHRRGAVALRAALGSPGPGLRRPRLPARRPAGHRRARRNRPGGGAGDAPERRLRAHVPGIAARRPLARPGDPLPPLRGRPDPALRLPPDQHAAARLHPLRPRGRARVPRHDASPACPRPGRCASPSSSSSSTATRSPSAPCPTPTSRRGSPRWGPSSPRPTGSGRSSSPTSTGRRRPTPSCATTSPPVAR